MKVVGLITEYNPFHNGHLYHIEKAKKLTGADFIIVVMSGNFVQRGAPALLDKYQRTMMALMAGADLVLELPVAYALASAEYFAYGAVKVLEGTGIVDEICFGSEAGSVKVLTEIVNFLEQDSPEFSSLLKKYLKTGMTFPKARELALTECNFKNSTNSTDWTEAIASPNNILGIEYIKAIKKLNSSIKATTIKRHLTGYHDLSLDLPISSATAIRQSLRNSNNIQSSCKGIKDSVPSYVYDILKDGLFLETNDFSSLFSYRLLMLPEETLSAFLDISTELAHRIYHMETHFLAMEDFITELKSKQYTHTRISRGLFHILLDIKTDDIVNFEKEPFIPYLRALGLKKTSTALLGAIKKNGNAPLLTKVSAAQHPLLLLDLQAAHLYNSVVYHKYGYQIPNEYKRGCLYI